MKHLGLDFDGALDRVGDKTILLGFFQDTRHAREIVGRGNHDPGFHDDFELNPVAAPLNFLERSLCR